jgi:hypothetical protein
MTDRFRRYLTSVLALGLGAVLGRAGWRDQWESPAGDVAVLPADHVPAAVSKSVSSRNSRPTARRHTEMSPESAALSAAWNFLKSGKHSRDQRWQLQEGIIKEWSAIDPESAIAAVLADVPYSQEWEVLLADCVLSLDGNPDHVLQMLEKEPFGVDTGHVRRKWLSGRASKEPVDTLGLLGQLSPLDWLFVLERVAGNLFGDGADDAEEEAIWSRLLELHGGETWESDAWVIAEEISDLTIPEMENRHRDRLLQATDPATVDLRATLKARQFVVFEFTEAQVKERLPVLPAEIRDAVLEKWKRHRKSAP